MRIVQLMASPFVGGPERQVLGLADALSAEHETVFLSFSERGLCRPFLEQARQQGFESIELRENAPHLRRAAREVAGHLLRLEADVLCCNGYKPDIIGWRAARLAGVPVVAVSHGWTAATWKVRLNETVDRLVLRWMDRVVCVSAAQAARVRRTGVNPERIIVIRNAIHTESFACPDLSYRARMQAWFSRPRTRLIAAAGRLSPEKGFDQFIAAAALVAKQEPEAGFVLFGEGPLRPALERQIEDMGLSDTFVLAGFHSDIQGFLPYCDVVVLSSWTEGLPVIVLEALAAGVPVVATAAGGTPEILDNGVNGFLVPVGKPAALASRIAELLGDDALRQRMGQAGRKRVAEQFTFAAQSEAYERLFRPLRPELGFEDISENFYMYMHSKQGH